MDLLHTIGSMLPTDLSAGRMFESFVLLAVIWRKLKPHLEAVEKRLKGLEDAVTAGFNAGEARFENIEGRLTVIEQGGSENGESVRRSGSSGSFEGARA